jgi:hypothetical protein
MAPALTRLVCATVSIAYLETFAGEQHRHAKQDAAAAREGMSEK